MQETGVPAALPGKHLDCREGQRRETHTHHVMAGEFAKRQPQRMIGGELLIAIGGYEQRAGALNTTADESKKVERRRVRPVKVLQHNHARAFRPCEFLEENPEEPVTRFVIPCDTPAELGGLGRNLVHRGERPRRAEPVARTPKRAHVTPMLRHESLDQCALAEPRFSSDEDEFAGTRACVLDAAVQCCELLLALEQMHDGSIIRHWSRSKPRHPPKR